MITLKSCPNCNSNNISKYGQSVEVNSSLTHEIMPSVEVNVTILATFLVCQNCNMIFQNPRFSDKELDVFYGQGYYRRMLNTTDDERVNDEEFRAKTDAEIIKKHLGSVNSHLDIGCGRGYLLDAVDAQHKVGVEPEVNYVKVKHVKTYREMNQIPDRLFDLVTAIHVLEHVPYPVDYLRNMAKRVKKGGHLVVEVPSWKSPGGSLRLAHLYHFETDVLKLMCAKVGLEVIHLEFTPHLLLICTKP